MVRERSGRTYLPLRARPFLAFFVVLFFAVFLRAVFLAAFFFVDFFLAAFFVAFFALFLATVILLTEPTMCWSCRWHRAQLIGEDATRNGNPFAPVDHDRHLQALPKQLASD